ncbi:hypothetical protein FRB99_008372 [Tulasnella sp. 403]|nr:hypothetical protein FRB99_008372 [Tulasnella sp. 403]
MSANGRVASLRASTATTVNPGHGDEIEKGDSLVEDDKFAEPSPPLDEEEYPEGGRGFSVPLCFTSTDAVCAAESLVWGVFQAYYKQHVLPDASDTTLSLLGTLQNMVMTFTAFISGKLGDRYGYKPFILIGSVTSCIGLLSAAFSTKLWQFFITQGLIPGLSNGMIFPMIVSYPSMWFKKKRALATGIVIAGSSFGGGAGSLIVRAMLTKIGLRYTLLSYFAINLVLDVVAFSLLKSRGPSRRVERIEWVDRSMFKNLVFWSLALCLLFTDFGYLPPIVFLTTYVGDKVSTASPQLTAAPTAVMNFSSAIGRTVVGLTADRIGVTNAFIGSIVISSLSQLILWNLAEGYVLIMISSVLVGAFGGCFISLLAPVTAQLFGTEKLATLSGLLILFNLPELVDQNESQIYRNAAALHAFIDPSYHISESGTSKRPALSLDDAKKPSATGWLCDVNSWKEFCRKHFMLEYAWTGNLPGRHRPEPELTVSGVMASGLHVHRFKIDEVERTVISTSERGGLNVSSIDTKEVLWFLPRDYVRPSAHAEYDGGFAVFDRFAADEVEVWRRTADSFNSETYLPCQPHQSQIDAAPDPVPLFPSIYPPVYMPPIAGSASSSSSALSISPPSPIPRRGAYFPFALLRLPGEGSAYRFVYPSLLVASGPQSEAYIWDIPTARLIQTITIEPITHPESRIFYVELNQDYVFVCWRSEVIAYSRQVGPNGQAGIPIFSLSMRESSVSQYPAFENMVPAQEEVPELANPIDPRSSLPFQTIISTTESERTSNTFFNDTPRAVHVSPDGRDLVVATHMGWLIYAPDFMQHTTPTDSSETKPPRRYGEFRMFFSNQIKYLAFDGDRILFATLNGLHSITVKDYLLRGSHRLGSMSVETDPPSVQHLMSFPRRARVSCIQLTKGAAWLAYPVLRANAPLPIQSIHAVQLVCKSLHDLVTVNEAQIYRTAAVLHSLVETTFPYSGAPDVLSDFASLSLQNASGPSATGWLDGISSWRTFCQKHFLLEKAWIGRGGNVSVKSFHSHGPDVHHFKIDEVERTAILTHADGGLTVIALDTDEVLWRLPKVQSPVALGPPRSHLRYSHMKDYVSPRAHVEFGGGFISFSRPGDMFEIWRRSADAFDPATYLPCHPDESQKGRTSDQVYIFPQEHPPVRVPPRPGYVDCGLPLPHRGAYVPWALLQAPPLSKASRLVYPNFATASSETQQVYIWDLPSCQLMQKVDVPRVVSEGENNDPTDSFFIPYIDISPDHIFVCRSWCMVAYSRHPYTGSGRPPEPFYIRGALCEPGYPCYEITDETPISLSQLSPTAIISQNVAQLPPAAIAVQDAGSSPSANLTAFFRAYRQYNQGRVAAAHVSPDGRDVVVATSAGCIHYVPDFEDDTPFEYRARKPFLLYLRREANYLAFDGTRILVATGTDLRAITLRDRRHLEQNAGDNYLISSLVQRILSYAPDHQHEWASCAQLTKHGAWVALPTRFDAGDARQNCTLHVVDFTDTVLPS